MKVTNTNNKIMKKPQVNIEKYKKDYLKMRLERQRKEIHKEVMKIIDKYRQNKLGFDYFGFVEEINRLFARDSRAF
jgi:hypothetical protein